MIQRIVFTIISLFLCRYCAYADGSLNFPQPLVNLGFKIGYQWSDKSSFIWGIEASIVYRKQAAIYGVVMNFDSGSFGTKQHIGLQVSSLPGGGEIGPTFAQQKNERTRVGFGGSIFTGLLLYPCYSYTWLPQRKDIHEVVLLLKYPLMY